MLLVALLGQELADLKALFLVSYRPHLGLPPLRTGVNTTIGVAFLMAVLLTRGVNPSLPTALEPGGGHQGRSLGHSRVHQGRTSGAITESW
jgi:hypothetical protein